MKLKKIAALALAGVMAVSMLAGCAGKGNTDKNEPSELSAAVVAELSKEATKLVDFKSTNDATTAVNALKAKYGTSLDLTTKFTAKELSAVSTSYSSVTNLTVSVTDPATVGNKNFVDLNENSVSATDIENAVKSETATFVVTDATIDGYTNVTAVAKALAKKISDDVVANKSLVANSGKYTAADGHVGRVDYTYTGTVSVYADTDVETGLVSYYAAYTITRTGSEIKSTI